MFRHRRPLANMPNAHQGWARELRSRPRKGKQWLLLHGLTLLCLLGLPYLRGRLRAKEKLQAYVQVAACVYGGAGRKDAGVAVPVDGPSHFAGRFLDPPLGWPQSCERPLERLRQDPAWVLLPAVKNAEADVQRAADLLLRELREMPKPGLLAQPVPVRPMLAMGLLGSAVSAHSSAADVPLDVPAHPGIQFSQDDTRYPNPSVVAINASESAATEIWEDGQGLHVVAVDSTGASYLGVRDSYPTRARLRSRRGLRHLASDGTRAYLVWSTSAERCAAQGSCATRSLGLAPVDPPLTRLPEPRWIAAHPFTRPDRSVAWRGDRLWIAAAQGDARGALRTLPLDRILATEQAGPALPFEVESRGIRDADDIALVAAGGGEQLGFAVVRDADRGRLLVTALGPAGRGESGLASLRANASPGWVVACEGPGPSAVRGFVAGNGRQLAVGHVGGGRPRSWHLELPVSAAVSSESRRQNRVRAVCHPEGTSAVVRRDDGVLLALRCHRDSAACELQEVASDVESFDVLAVPKGVLVAFAGPAPDAEQIRLRSLPHEGDASEPFVAAPCWRTRRGGLCGAPLLQRVEGRILLGARNGFDMVALQSTDEGQTWIDLGPWFLPAPAADRPLGVSAI